MPDDTEHDALREQVEQHERRITELEIDAAFRRQTSDDLDEVLREQGRRLAQLERRVAELVGQLDLVADD
ncbi:SlyX family protein [Enhygromyxa salina]|nr:SlyX family protein [Enhygromyxa salina]